MNLLLLTKMNIPLADHSLEGLCKEEDSSDWRELSTFQHGLQKIQWKDCLDPAGGGRGTSPK